MSSTMTTALECLIDEHHTINLHQSTNELYSLKTTKIEDFSIVFVLLLLL